MTSTFEEVKEGLESAWGFEVDAVKLAACIQQSTTDPLIKEYEGYSMPVALWIQDRPELAWFVSPGNVARVAYTIRGTIRTKHPGLSAERRARMELGSWFYTLLHFAQTNGFVADESLVYPPAQN